jgi:hypothetical protein
VRSQCGPDLLVGVIINMLQIGAGDFGADDWRDGLYLHGLIKPASANGCDHQRNRHGALDAAVGGP